MGSFEKYALGFVMLTFGAAMILNFSGSVFDTYDADVDSDTLEKIKQTAEANEPAVGEQTNRTAGISPEENAFLSPQGFGIIGDILSSANNMKDLIKVFVTELKLPFTVVGLIVGIITIKLMMEALSALFGWDL